MAKGMGYRELLGVCGMSLTWVLRVQERMITLIWSSCPGASALLSQGPLPRQPLLLEHSNLSLQTPYEGSSTTFFS